MEIELIAFDADDTLWHNEMLYRQARAKFMNLFANWADMDELGRQLDRTEIHNLEWYGYGIKGFALSMVQTACDFFSEKVNGLQIRAILRIIEEMIEEEVRLLDDVVEVLEYLHKRYRLLLITKGDLFEQQRKINRSGIKPYFSYIEVVEDKTREVYQQVLVKYRCLPQNFLMVGNSMRSDIIPVLQIGGRAIYIPYTLTWSHETVESATYNDHDFDKITHLKDLPALIEYLDGRVTH